MGSTHEEAAGAGQYEVGVFVVDGEDAMNWILDWCMKLRKPIADDHATYYGTGRYSFALPMNSGTTFHMAVYGDDNGNPGRKLLEVRNG